MDDSPVVSPTTIYDLPNEMLDNIFTYLGVLDIGRCMMVSKHCHSIGSRCKIKELIFNDEFSKYDKKWRTGESYDENMMIDNRHHLNALPLNITFLRRLSIHANTNPDFKFHHLNKLMHLEHLELKFFERDYPKGTLTPIHRLSWKVYDRGITFLNLPNLKTLNCKFVDHKLVFNAPNLDAVYMSGSTDIRFRNLPTLKLLHYDSTNGNEGVYVFNRIKKIEVFRIAYRRNLEICYDVLTHLDEVKEIRFDFRPLTNCMSREYFVKEFANIFEERRRQNKTHVKIFMFDILIVEGKTIDEYGFENVKYKGKLPFHIS